MAEQTLCLEELPWHRLALESKKAMLVNQSDPEGMMPDSEIKSAFSRPINSAVLVPLVVGDKTIGLLSLAEERDWNRRPFTQPEILTAELAAEQLANLIGQSLWDEKPAVAEALAAGDKRFNQLRKTISDPLTTIMGASELLLVRKEQLEPELLRYAYIIQKMSERIKDSINCASEPADRQAERVDS
jgi:GAF domain-containing protein